jgi:7-carboxy-7-deazaguanine synthase
MCEVVTVSPKPPSAGNITQDYTVEKFIRQVERQDFNYRGRLVLKIVIFDDQDYEYAKDIFQLFPDYERWVQVGNPVVEPLLDNGQHALLLLDKLQWLSEKLLADESFAMLDVRVTPQMHTLMWGNARAT